MFDLRIDGGCVSRSGMAPHVESIGVVGGSIVAVGDLRQHSAKRVLDVTGAHILPGIIDTHVHIGYTDLEKELRTETRAAGIGGVTTILIYFRALDDYGEILTEFLEMAKERCHVDFGIHLGILHDDHLRSLEAYVSEFGIRSIKMYTTYKGGQLKEYGVIGQDDGFILDVFKKLAGRRDVIANVHCENDDIASRGEQAHVPDAGNFVEAWSMIRPPVAEEEAVRRIGLLAREAGNRVYIPHVSSRRALEAAVEERGRGADLAIETCPHYLRAEELKASGGMGKVNPPIRNEEDSAALWQALRTGMIDTIGTDHVALMRRTKGGDDLLKTRPGFPGLGTLLPVLLDGVNRGEIGLDVIAALQARAARLFALNRKGQIEPGYDCDLAIVDMNLRKKVDAAATGSLSDFSPFEGRELVGWPIMTLVRGEIVAEGGSPRRDEEAVGRYVRLPDADQR